MNNVIFHKTKDLEWKKHLYDYHKEIIQPDFDRLVKKGWCGCCGRKEFKYPLSKPEYCVVCYVEECLLFELFEYSFKFIDNRKINDKIRRRIREIRSNYKYYAEKIPEIPNSRLRKDFEQEKEFIQGLDL